MITCVSYWNQITEKQQTLQFCASCWVDYLFTIHLLIFRRKCDKLLSLLICELIRKIKKDMIRLLSLDTKKVKSTAKTFNCSFYNNNRRMWNTINSLCMSLIEPEYLNNTFTSQWNRKKKITRLIWFDNCYAWLVKFKMSCFKHYFD